MAHKTPMLHSIYDLTTFCRATTGDVPAKLVGASTTVVGSKMYLFGGRLVAERRMVSELYVFDLETFVWERIPVSPEDDIPRARYFHSTDAWNNHLVVFGGMSNQLDSTNPDELCVLNDVRFFDLTTRHWLPELPTLPESDPLLPRARYAHLSSVTGDRLFIIGGQDFFNTWLDDVCVFDLAARTWVQRRDYPRHCGTYRSVAVSSTTTVRSPQEERQAVQSASTLGPSGSRFKSPKVARAGPPEEYTSSENLIHLPYSSAPTEDNPSDIYLYSNYNFTDVKRELEVFSPLPDTDFTIQDKSSAMTGSTFPPGLRFPTGAILGNHLIIAGTYLAHSYQSFSIWVLDLTTMTWSRIDPGKAIETGSWFRGCLWAESNKFLIFGNRHGNLVDDYNRRLLSWDHVAVVDLEAFGIYQPPPLKLDVRMQELGLAAFEERVMTDFEIICEDGQKITCSRRVLEDRWPWFKEQRKQFLKKANVTLESLPSSSMHITLPDLAGNAFPEEPRIDPRLTPRSFYLSEPYPVALALVQYFYSQALITPLQHTAGVLSQLLILATNYRITHLESLVKHAMHRALSNPTSVGVYEVATLCSCRSLQIRALKTVMSYTQKRPSRRTEKEGGSSRRPDSAGDRDGGSGGGNGPSSSKYVSRPRGTSDAKWRTMTDSGASSSGYNSQSHNTMPISTDEEAFEFAAGAMVSIAAASPPGSIDLRSAMVTMPSAEAHTHGPPALLPDISVPARAPIPAYNTKPKSREPALTSPVTDNPPPISPAILPNPVSEPAISLTPVPASSLANIKPISPTIAARQIPPPPAPAITAMPIPPLPAAPPPPITTKPLSPVLASVAPPFAAPLRQIPPAPSSIITKPVPLTPEATPAASSQVSTTATTPLSPLSPLSPASPASPSEKSPMMSYDSMPFVGSVGGMMPVGGFGVAKPLKAEGSPRSGGLKFSAISARLPRRPTTADASMPVPGRPPFIQTQSADDVRGTLISKRRTGPSMLAPVAHSRQGSLAQFQPNNTSIYGRYSDQRPAPIQTQSDIPGSNSYRISTTSTANSSVTISSESPSSLTTPADSYTFRSSQITAVETEFSVPEEEYQVLDKDDTILLGETMKPANQKGSFWSLPGRTRTADTAVDDRVPRPVPLSNLSTPRSGTPVASSTSSSSSFARFLSRPSKERRERANTLTEDDSSSTSGNTATNHANPTVAMAQIKNQIAELEEERKRLKKEAKIRALLLQTTSPGIALGGMM